MKVWTTCLDDWVGTMDLLVGDLARPGTTELADNASVAPPSLNLNSRALVRSQATLLVACARREDMMRWPTVVNNLSLAAQHIISLVDVCSPVPFQTRSHTLRPVARARPTESKYNASGLAILILSVCDARAAHA